jgi:hypothetical protein
MRGPPRGGVLRRGQRRRNRRPRGNPNYSGGEGGRTVKARKVSLSCAALLLTVTLLAGSPIRGAAAGPRRGAPRSPAFAVGQKGVAMIVRRIVAAAGRRDAGSFAVMLSARTRSEASRHAASALAATVRRSRAQLAELAQSVWQIVFIARIRPQLAVAALAGTRATANGPRYSADALALRLEPRGWRLELTRLIRIRALLPRRSVTLSYPQVAFEVTATTAIEEGELWADSLPITGSSGGTGPRRITFFGRPALPLARGRHMAVAFAIAGGVPEARAWLFRVRAGEQLAS